MLWTVLITSHTVAAVVALLAGLVAFRVRALLPVHLVAMLVMTGTLIPAVALEARPVPLIARLVFVGLCALAVVMCVTAWRAMRFRRPEAAPTDPRSTDGLTFGCIGLSVGFVAIALVGIDAPVVVIVVASIATVAAGRFVPTWRSSAGTDGSRRPAAGR
jgi:hypothetical protein